MRWGAACGCALWLATLTGCPETYRRGGRADRAALKDAKDQIPERICSEDVYELYCADDEESEDCLRHCGG
jgi:hypothetical protein